ncbi:MAG: MSMEG_1061 family FMN-dependent PPOX-type flavoprotein [Bermanella sp.]
MEELNSLDAIRAVLGEPRSTALKKIYSELNPRMTEFISRSPLIMMSTVDEDGWPTISPRGDVPGFVQSQDSGTLLIPEYKGNKLAFSLQNLLVNNKVALLFTLPGVSEVLRVHGTCRILKDPELCRQLASSSQNALMVIEVRVINAYFHCGKAMLRSQAWNSKAWPEPMKVSLGLEVAENTKQDNEFAADYDKGVNERYVTDL